MSDNPVSKDLDSCDHAIVIIINNDHTTKKHGFTIHRKNLTQIQTYDALHELLKEIKDSKGTLLN